MTKRLSAACWQCRYITAIEGTESPYRCKIVKLRWVGIMKEIQGAKGCLAPQYRR